MKIANDKNKTTLVCKICGKSFTKFRSVVKCPETACCSRSCANKYKKIALRGERNPRWNGGVHYRPDGRNLIYAPDHPSAIHGRYVLEYRLIAERMLGRFLHDNEIVHHKNGNVQDNRVENLEVITQKEHATRHGKEFYKQGRLKLNNL